MNRRTEVVPGLTLDESLFEVAAAGLAAHAAHLPALSWEGFTDPTSWWLIPEEDGLLSKAELTVVKGAAETVKLNIWFRGDVRDRGRPMPHNHPWDSFTGHVLSGGYSEDRYVRDTGYPRGVSFTKGVEHVASSGNVVPKALFHEVREIHEPGRTLSLMTCSTGRRGDWGYLDIDTGGYVANSDYQPVADFTGLLMALNPQHRKD